MSRFHCAGVEPSSASSRREHFAGSAMLQPTAAAEPRLGRALSLAATYTSTFALSCHPNVKVLSSVWHRETVLGQQAHPELPLDAWKACICATSRWQPSFLCSLHSAVRWPCSLHLPPQFQVPPRSLQPRREAKDADRGLAKKNVPGRKRCSSFLLLVARIVVLCGKSWPAKN